MKITRSLTVALPTDYEQTGKATTLKSHTVSEGSHVTELPGDLFKLDAVFESGTADAFGVEVLSDGESGTKVGYDTSQGKLFVDRTKSGNVSFNSTFPSVDSAPVATENGQVRFTAYVDRSSVEVFAAAGKIAITDLVYPNAGANQISLWARGGEANLVSLTVTPLKPSIGSEQIELAPEMVPGAPTAVTGVSKTVGTAELSWAVPANTGDSPITGYRAYAREITADGELVGEAAQQVCEVSGSTTNCLADGLTPKASYVFTAEAINSAGPSPRSEASAPATILQADDSGKVGDSGQNDVAADEDPDRDSGIEKTDGNLANTGLNSTGMTAALGLVVTLIAGGCAFSISRARRKQQNI